jgi:hypothetical protein
MNIGEVYLDKWNFHCEKSVSKSDGSVCVGRRIHKNAIYLVDSRMDSLHKLAFPIALVALKVHSQLFCNQAETLFNAL